ncbi:MAG: bacterial Ig-like domain-containing protein [Treponemataceae bacterium]|nr:bacterial Ig-like domain-containing protein [Treponemataceae bacterium]
MKKFSKCMVLLATLSLFFSLFSCKQEPDDPDLSEVSVDLKEKEKVFFEGDTLSKEDVVVMAFYSDRSTKDVTNKAKFTPELPCTLTTSFDLTIDYEEKKAALKIEVGKKTDYYEDESGKRIKLKEISLALKDSDKQFFEGDVISKDDFVVTAKYEDDTTKIVTDGVTFEGLTDEKLTVGNKTIKATYGSQVKSLDIAVHERGAKVTSILLTLKAGRTFFVGDTISTDDFTVIAIFSDGTTEDVTWYSSFEGLGKQTESGNVKITATYSSKITSITVKVVISETLYIYDYDETVGEWEWKSMQVEKEGSCFYYEFERTGTIDFCISTSKSWSGQIGRGVAIPQTGDYVVLNNYNSEDTAVVIANLEDRIYIRYEEGIYYARYVSQDKITELDPDEHIESVASILFDIGFKDVDEIGFSYIPEYMLKGEKLEVDVFPHSESALCNYTYQWWFFNSNEWYEVDGATSTTSPNFEEGNSYCCVVTAISIDNPQYKIEKNSPSFYICSKNMDDVSLSDTTINLNNAEITKNLWVINPYCDSIEWEVSDPFMVALDGYSNIGGNKTYEVTLRALRNGEATITVTMTRGGVEKSFTCTVTVSGLNVEEGKYSWWYYELDTSEASDSQAVGLIFNHSLGMIQTKDIKNVQSKGEIFYKWDGEGRTVLAEVDKSKVDESILQTGLDTENKLVVYVSVPDRVSSVYLHAWDMNIPAPFTFTGEQWPGVLMKECTASDENPAE